MRGHIRDKNVVMRNFIPRALLVVVLAVTGASAALGASGFGTGSAVTSGGTGSRQELSLVGMSVGQAVRVAHSHGITVELWRVPASSPVGTVIQQVNYEPAYLVVSSGRPKDRWAVLSEAAGPPVHAECAPGFELETDGNAGPATCGGGHVNVAAWDYFAASRPPMLALGRAATRCDVARSYDDQLTAPMNRTVYELAHAYYGWRFGSELAEELGRSGAHADGCSTR